MAKKIHKLSQGGKTIYPATTTDAVVHPDLRVSSSTLVEEVNVSKIFPTGGIGGSNKYTLETAIAQIPSSLRTVGIKCSFINEGGTPETWTYQGGAFTSSDSWMQGGNGAGGNLILEWNTDDVTTRNQIKAGKRKKGIVISYKNPNVTVNNGWVTEQYIADDIPENVLWGYDNRWKAWNYQEQVDNIKSELVFDYQVTYNSNFGSMLLAVPKEIRKQFLIVAYTDNNGDLIRIIRTAPFNQEADGDAGWYASTAWETLVSRKELDGVKKDILLRPFAHFIVTATKSGNGIYDKATNTLKWDTSTTPQVNTGITFIFGRNEHDVMERVRTLSMLGIRPNIRLLIETENLNVNANVYVYDIKNNLVLNKYLVKSSNGGMIQFQYEGIECGADTWYITSSVLANTKIDNTKESYIKIVSADLYYSDVIANNFFIHGDADELFGRSVEFDTDSDMSENKYCTIIDEETALITIPKGTELNARDVIIPLKSFHQVFDFGSTLGASKMIKVTSEGKSVFSELDFAEISVATAVTISKFSLSKIQSDKNNETLYICALDNLGNYDGPYGYNSLAVRCGKNPKTVLEDDFICKIRMSILDFSQSENLSDELIRLKTSVSDLRKNIGAYTVTRNNHYCGIVGKSNNVILSDKYTFRIDKGTNEQNEYADLLISVSRVRELGITEPEYTLMLITDKTSKDKIGLTADILSEFGVKIQSSTVSYDEIYNGIVTVKFKLLKQLSGIRFVKVRCTFTTQLSEGMSVSVSNCSVSNLKESDSIAETLHSLQYANNPIILRSSGGKEFRLTVSDDGKLSTTYLLPKRMMVMSHSWGLIPYNPAQGWCGNWGMAASEESLDMVHQIETLGKSLNPEFTTFFYRFATFATNFKQGASWFEQFDCSDLDFDSIFICSFAAGPNDGDWNGFGQALYDCLINYVCKGKSGVKIYVSDYGPTEELEKVCALLGTELIDLSEAMSKNGTGWPWLMPAKPDGTRPIKANTLPDGANPEDYILVGPLNHPGNWGFYTVAKKVVNKMYEDFGIENPDPTIMDFETYKKQPGISKWVDPEYPYE